LGEGLRCALAVVSALLPPPFNIPQAIAHSGNEAGRKPGAGQTGQPHPPKARLARDPNLEHELTPTTTAASPKSSAPCIRDAYRPKIDDLHPVF